MDILIYGSEALGRQLHYIIHTYFKNDLNIIGFIDDTKEEGATVVGDLTVLGSLEHIYESGKYNSSDVKIVHAIGYNNIIARRDAFDRARKFGYEFQSIIHPKAVVEKNATIGEGVVVFAGSVVDQGVNIGDLNFIDIGVTIGEDTYIGSNNYFSNGSTIAGSVKIGENNFFGLNSTVVDNVTIGNNNFINAKTLIYKNLADNFKVVEFYEQRLIGNKS